MGWFVDFLCHQDMVWVGLLTFSATRLGFGLVCWGFSNSQDQDDDDGTVSLPAGFTRRYYMNKRNQGLGSVLPQIL